MRKTFIAGNWKMFKTSKEAKAFAEEFLKIYKPGDVKVAVAAPFTDLAVLKKAFKGSGVHLSAQNMHWAESGAFTGEISAEMLKDAGAEYCIIGHSERRAYFKETDASVNKKLKKALSCGILPILCVGESLKVREAGKENEFVETQLRKDLRGITPEDAAKITIAYEPIWAIGTGKTASPAQAQEMCAFIRSVIREICSGQTADEICIQYGGSVKPSNAKELLNSKDIDGALVGGASLKPQDFLDIIDFNGGN